MTHPAGLSCYVVDLRVDSPSLADNTADAERLEKALSTQLGTDRIIVPAGLLRQLPKTLRQADHRIKAVVFPGQTAWMVAAVLPMDHPRTVAGIAMDIGTTRVALSLVDLATGQVLKETGFDNPQSGIGPDVLTRIHHAMTETGRERLRALIVDEVNVHIDSLCRDQGLGPEDVFLVAGAGNTAMTHLFLGIDPFEMIKEPYIPCVNVLDTLCAREAGLDINTTGLVFLFPNIGSYFGGDLMAGLLFSKLDEKEAPCILVDVGTNAEIVVGNKDWLIACAGAAGPALEGGVSAMGMTARPGVIDRVVIDARTLDISVHTIDDKPPVGICGSGMIDLAAQLFLSGMIDIRGKFVPEICRERLKDKDGIQHFILVEKNGSGTGTDILFSQADLNSLTSSKAAMYTILEVIVRHTAGIDFTDLESFFVAGTFGSYIDPASAISIGMLPDLEKERFHVLGNSSLKGACMMLTTPGAFDRVMAIRQGITYIELNVNQEFMNLFSGAKFYPHTDRSRFPSVPVPG